MSQNPDAIHPHDLNNFKALMNEYKGLLTFEQVASWDQRASAEVEQIANAIREADAKRADASRRLEQTKQERAEQNFIARLFSSQKIEKSLDRLIQQFIEYKTSLEGLAAQLQESIDFTPNSPEEQASLIKELRQRKKELQLEKREVAAAMKAVRDDARQRSARAGQALGGLIYSSKVAASERRGIRYAKEAAVRPHEDAKAAIERQLVQVDRDILWAEKFTAGHGEGAL